MKTKTWIAAFALLLAVCTGLSAWVLWPREAASHARITSDGTLVATLDLRKDDSLTVAYGDGYNHIAVENGKIAVTDASCPDHYCMKRGFLNSGTDIVCLPNRMVISFVTESPEVDGAVG